MGAETKNITDLRNEEFLPLKLKGEEGIFKNEIEFQMRKWKNLKKKMKHI